MSELRWFRMYGEFATDPAVQCLSFDDQRHYVIALCLKCSGVLDKEYPHPQQREHVLRKAFGLDTPTLAEAKRRLCDAGLIDGDWQPLAWDKRQYRSDSSAERTKRWRDKKKSAEKPRRSSDVTVTDPSVSVSVSESVNKKDSVERIFEHWKTTHDHPRAKLDPKRRKMIRERLEDYSEADLCQAISGFRNSPHHMGETDGTVYDSIELFMRDAKHVDMGLKFFEKPPERRSAATDSYHDELRRAMNANN